MYMRLFLKTAFFKDCHLHNTFFRLSKLRIVYNFCVKSHHNYQALSVMYHLNIAVE